MHDAFARRAVRARARPRAGAPRVAHRILRRPRVVGAGADRRRLRLYAAGMECAGPEFGRARRCRCAAIPASAVVVPRLADRIFHAPLSAVLHGEPRLRRGVGGGAPQLTAQRRWLIRARFSGYSPCMRQALLLRSPLTAALLALAGLLLRPAR